MFPTPPPEVSAKVSPPEVTAKVSPSEVTAKVSPPEVTASIDLEITKLCIPNTYTRPSKREAEPKCEYSPIREYGRRKSGNGKGKKKDVYNYNVNSAIDFLKS